MEESSVRRSLVLERCRALFHAKHGRKLGSESPWFDGSGAQNVEKANQSCNTRILQLLQQLLDDRIEIPAHVLESTPLWLLKRMGGAGSLKGIGDPALLAVANHLAPVLLIPAKDITCGNFAGLSNTVVRDHTNRSKLGGVRSAERLSELHAALVLRFPPPSTQLDVAGPAEADLSLAHQPSASAESATSQSDAAPPGVSRLASQFLKTAHLPRASLSSCVCERSQLILTRISWCRWRIPSWAS